MKYQRGVALSGLIFWGVIIALVAVLGMKVVPTTIEYYKILKDVKATVNKVGPDATVADVRQNFRQFRQYRSVSTSNPSNSIFPRMAARSLLRSPTTSAFRCLPTSVC